jgi:hypothetical protein
MRRYTLTVALICFVTALSSVALHARQPVVISGKVTDTQGRPIAGALIAVPALNESTVSDDEGMYRLAIRSKARLGQEAVIRASREGFDYVSRSVRLGPKAQVRVDFRLVPVR